MVEEGQRANASGHRLRKPKRSGSAVEEPRLQNTVFVRGHDQGNAVAHGYDHRDDRAGTEGGSVERAGTSVKAPGAERAVAGAAQHQWLTFVLDRGDRRYAAGVRVRNARQRGSERRCGYQLVRQALH